MTSPSRTAPETPRGVPVSRSARIQAARQARPPARRRTGLPTVVIALLVLLCAAIGALAGGLYGLSRPDKYAAHAYVLVAPTTGQIGDVNGSQLASAFARIAADPSVVGGALASQGLPAAPRNIARTVSATASADAPLIDVAGTTGNAGQSALVANTAARALIDHVTRLGATPGYRTVLLTPATVPDRPSGSPALVYGLLGGVLGLGLGSAVAAVRRP